jgi:Holliday junction DNA helicase RuvA
LAVREDSLELFGFLSTEELDSFKMLINVSGIGPKVALSVLSTLDPGSLASAILRGDVHAISQAQGIGGKTASRIVLECKDKVGKSASPVTVLPSGSMDLSRKNVSEAIDALVVLGYRRSEAENAVRRIDPSGKEIEEIIRESLKSLS